MIIAQPRMNFQMPQTGTMDEWQERQKKAKDTKQYPKRSKKPRNQVRSGVSIDIQDP
jgi:hypothetical protein